jgi:hypothetical protein
MGSLMEGHGELIAKQDHNQNSGNQRAGNKAQKKASGNGGTLHRSRYFSHGSHLRNINKLFYFSLVFH